MTMWALIVNGEVHEVTAIDPNDRFHPSMKWVPCNGNVKQGMLYVNGEFFEAQSDE